MLEKIHEDNNGLSLQVENLKKLALQRAQEIATKSQHSESGDAVAEEHSEEQR